MPPKITNPFFQNELPQSSYAGTGKTYAQLEAEYAERERELEKRYAPQIERHNMQQYLSSGAPISDVPGQYGFKSRFVEENTPKHSVAGFLQNAARDFSDMWSGIIAMPAIGYRIATDENPVETLKHTGITVWEGVVDEYSKAYGRGVGSYLEAVYDRPVSRLMDILGVASLGAGAGAKGAQVFGKGGKIASTLGKTSRIAGRAVNVLDPLGASWEAGKWLAKGPVGEALGLHPVLRGAQAIFNRAKPRHYWQAKKVEIETFRHTKGLTEAEIADLPIALEMGNPRYRQALDAEGNVIKHEVVDRSERFMHAYDWLHNEQRSLDATKMLTEQYKPGAGLTPEVIEQGQYRRYIEATEPTLRELYGHPEDYYRDAQGAIQRGGVERWKKDIEPIEGDLVRTVFGFDEQTVNALRQATPNGLIFDPVHVMEVNKRFMPNELMFENALHNRFLTTGGVLGRKAPSPQHHHKAWTGAIRSDQIADARVAFVINKQQFLKSIETMDLADQLMKHLDSRNLPLWQKHFETHFADDYRAAMSGAPREELSDVQRIIAETMEEVNSGRAWIRIPKSATGAMGKKAVLPPGYVVSRVPEQNTFIRAVAELSEKQMSAARRFMESQGLDAQKYIDDLGDIIKQSSEETILVNKAGRIKKIDLEDGIYVKAADRDNYGKIVKKGQDFSEIHFVNKNTGAEATVSLPNESLTGLGRTEREAAKALSSLLGPSANYVWVVRADLENKALANIGGRAGLAGYLWDMHNNAFRWAVLKASPRWLAGNVVGSAVFHMMSRGGAGTIADIPRMWKAFTDPEYIDRLYESGVLTPGQAAGIYSSGQMFSRQHLGAGLSENAIAKGVDNLAQKITESNNPILRAMLKIPDKIGDINERVEAAFRTAHITREFESQAPIRGLMKKDEAKRYISAIMAGQESHKVLAEMLPSLIDPKTGKMSAAARTMFEDAREACDYWTNYAHLNYTSFTPLERNLLKRLFPVSYSFWRGSAMLALTYPVTHPMRMWTIGRMGSALAEMRADEGEDIPTYLKNSINLGLDPVSGKQIRWNLTAFNPLGQFASRLAETKTGTVGELLSSIAIGPEALAPMLKVALEQATGYEMFRRQPFSAPGASKFSGQRIAPPLWWHIMSQVPQGGILRDIATAIQTPEGMTGTHYGTSTPLDPQLYRDKLTGAIKTPKPWYQGIRSLAGFSQSYFDPEAFQQGQTREKHAAIGAQYKALTVGEEMQRRARQQAMRMAGGGIP
jgi:hypothetical protein